MQRPIARTLIVALAMFLGAGPAPADEEGPGGRIDGTFRMGRPGCAGDKSQYCQVNLEIGGELARLLYESMRSKPAADACTEGFVKSDDPAFACYAYPNGEHRCDFGYDFVKKKLVQSDVTC